MLHLHYLHYIFQIQAAEKALKALIYYTNADGDLKSHRLPTLARATKDSTLIGLAASLEGVAGSYFRLRYPDAVGGHTSMIPSELYDADDAEAALRHAKEIVELVAEKM